MNSPRDISISEMCKSVELRDHVIQGQVVITIGANADVEFAGSMQR